MPQEQFIDIGETRITYSLHQRLHKGREEYAWVDADGKLISPIFTNGALAKKWRIPAQRIIANKTSAVANRIWDFDDLLRRQEFSMRPEERLQFWSNLQEGYCVHCGAKDPNCQCSNDE